MPPQPPTPPPLVVPTSTSDPVSDDDHQEEVDIKFEVIPPPRQIQSNKNPEYKTSKKEVNGSKDADLENEGSKRDVADSKDTSLEVEWSKIDDADSKDTSLENGGSKMDVADSKDADSKDEGSKVDVEDEKEAWSSETWLKAFFVKCLQWNVDLKKLINFFTSNRSEIQIEIQICYISIDVINLLLGNQPIANYILINF